MKYLRYYENLIESETFKKISVSFLSDWESTHTYVSFDPKIISKLEEKYINSRIEIDKYKNIQMIKMYNMPKYDCISLIYYDDNWIIVQTEEEVHDDSWTIEHYICDDEIGLFDCLDFLIK